MEERGNRRAVSLGSEHAGEAEDIAGEQGPPGPAVLRLGVNPVVWTNDDLPALGDDISLERCLSEARAAGYAGIELGHKFPRDAHLLRGLLGAHGLVLVSGWYGGRILERGARGELAAAEEQIELLRSLGSSVLIYAEVSGCVHGARGRPIEARRHLERQDLEALGQELNAFAEGLSERGLELAYHHHMGTVIQTMDELERLLEVTGESVGLCLDTGHIAFAGGVPEEVARRFGARVRHVHLKDVRRNVVRAAASGPSSYLDAIVGGVFTVPGDGDLDFVPVLEALRDGGYAGWLVVEADQDPRLAEPARFARMGAAHVRRLAEQVGLRITSE